MLLLLSNFFINFNIYNYITYKKIKQKLAIKKTTIF